MAEQCEHGVNENQEKYYQRSPARQSENSSTLSYLLRIAHNSGNCVYMNTLPLIKMNETNVVNGPMPW